MERIHGALRRFDRLLVVVRFPTRCRRGRSRRSGSLLRFDRRLFPARTSRSRTRHFFTRNPARTRKRSDHRCSPRRLVRLANAFVIMGVGGLALAPILRASCVTSREGHSCDNPAGTVFPILARKPAFWLLAFASSASSLCGYGLALWTPKVMMLSFGLNLVSTGNFLASVLLIGGCAGVFAGGWFADHLGARDLGWHAKLPAIAWLVSVPAWGIGLFAPNLWIAWPLLLIGTRSTSFGSDRSLRQFSTWFHDQCERLPPRPSS